MPGFIGKKLCPDLVIVPTNFDKYTEVSKQVRELMSEYDPNFCPMSLDEAYLDITQYLLKRQKFTEAERTFICRKNGATISQCNDTCFCDLNNVLKDRIPACRSVLGCYKSGATDVGLDCNTTGEKFDGQYPSREGSTSGMEACGTKGNESNVENKKSKISVEDDRRCPECGKQLPEYEFVIFGLDAEEVVRELRCRIEQRTRLTASAGMYIADYSSLPYSRLQV